MMMVSKHHTSSVGFPDSGGWAGGVGGDDDNIGTQTPRTISPQQPFLQYFRTEGTAGDNAPDSKLSGPKELQSFLDDSYVL